MTAPVVGFVGLGNMGSVLAGNLVGSGFTVLTHDLAGPSRNPDGATFVETLAEVSAAAVLVVLSLPNGAASSAVAASIVASVRPALRLVIDTSTIGPTTARSIAASLETAGIGYVDAPVSGGVAGARARTLTVMYSGRPEACETAWSIIQGLSDRRFHVGDEAGLAQAMKLANNFLSATALAATSEAVAFATASGIDMATVLEVLNASSGRSGASEDKFVNHVLTGTYASGFASDLMAKDVGLYLDEVEAAAAPDVVARVTADIWQRFGTASPGVDFTEIYRFTTDAT